MYNNECAMKNAKCKMQLALWESLQKLVYNVET